MRSLRGRLFAYLVGGAGILFLAAGLALTWAITSWLQREFDRGLLARAQALVALTEQEGAWIEFDLDGAAMPEFGDPAAPEYFELWAPDGSLLERSASFELGDRAPGARLVRTVGPAPVPAFLDLRLPDGRQGRQVRIDFAPRRKGEAAPPDRPLATVIVARAREGLDADLRRFQLGIGAAALGLTAALAALTQAALRIGLRALDRLDRQVRALGVGSLGRRVSLPSPPEEIAAVVRQINALLDRLEAGFERERRLSSDIAHELKTPVAELRSLCEVGARWPEDRTAVREFFGDARAIALSMERTVGHLLALARYEGGREETRAAPVPVAEVVDAAWRPLARAAAAKGLRCQQQIAPALRFDTDPDRFPVMVANILSNAVTHSPPGTTILCASDETGGRPSVSFSNRAENLEPPDLAVMFDRFWRKDAGRADGHNVGLGLSLVRAMADLLAIEIATDLSGDKTFRITLCAPSRPARANPEPGRRCDGAAVTASRRPPP